MIVTSQLTTYTQKHTLRILFSFVQISAELPQPIAIGAIGVIVIAIEKFCFITLKVPSPV